jgi:hypothetical protein
LKPHGGRRQGAGRKKGAATKRTQEIVERANAEGETPLEYMLRIMRTSDDDKRKDAMATAAAPYVHPRLTSIDGSLNVNLRHEQALDDLE